MATEGIEGEASNTAPLPTELREGTLTLWEAIMQSFAFIGPAGDVAILLVGTALVAKGATPLAVLVGWVIYGFWMNTPIQFSKEIVNAGSFYAYSARGLNGWGGVLALWYWIGENVMAPSFAMLGLGSFVFLLVPSRSPAIWVVIACAVLLYGTVISWLGVKLSARYNLWSGLLETTFLIVTAVIIIVEAGSNNTLTVFTTAPLNGNVHLLLFGAVFSVLDFTGLGTATTVSEETKDSKTTITRAIPIAWILAGIALIIPAYALTVGWGVPKMASYGTAADPGLIVYRHYLGTVGWALLIAFTVNSYLMYMVAKVNAVTRTWFSAARDGVMHPGLRKVHARLKTPHVAIAVFFVSTLAANLIAAAILGPDTGALWLLSASGICIIAVHIVGNFALTFYTIAHHKFEFFTHGLIPSLATIFAGIVLFYSAFPIPKEPLGSSIVFALCWLLVGFLVAAYYAFRRPDVLREAGRSRG